jgi:hypothetical protein
MSEKTQYYRVEGGPVAAAWEKWKEMRKFGTLQALALQQELWACATNTKGVRIGGFEFKGGKPDGWRVAHGGYLPSKRSGSGRLLAKRIEEIYIPTVWEFQAMVLGKFKEGESGSPFHFMDGLRCQCMSFEVIGGTMVLGVPITNPNAEMGDSGGDSCGWFPEEGCYPLKLSEYYALKEAADSTKKS